MKWLSPVCPSVCPSVSLLKIGSLVFSDIAHDDSWPWHLATDRVTRLKKKFGGQNLGQMGQNRAQSYVFCFFLKFGSLVFLEIAYNYSLQRCVTTSGVKIHEKFFLVQIWVKSTKIGSKIKFFVIFSSLVH